MFYRRGGLLLGIYLVVGLIVAASQNYFSGLRNVTDLLEALLAVIIWPALLFGVDVNVGGGGRGGGG